MFLSNSMGIGNILPSNSMGIGVAGTFKASDYTNAGYTGVGLASFNSAIGKGKQVVGQYTIPYWKGGKGGGGKQFFVVADAPQPQQQAAPAPAPAPAGPNYKNQLAELTAASKKYKQEAEKLIAAGQKKVAQLEDEQLKAEKAQQLQAQLAIQSAVSKNLGQMAPTVKGAPTSKMQIGGTQKFKTAPKQFYLPQIQTASGLNIPTANTLNI